MASLLRRLRKLPTNAPASPAIRVIGYGAPGVIRVELSDENIAPGLYPLEAIGMRVIGAVPPITHVEVLSSGADHG